MLIRKCLLTLQCKQKQQSKMTIKETLVLKERQQMRIDLVVRRLLDMLTRRLPTEKSRYQVTERDDDYNGIRYRVAFSNDGGITWHPVKGYHISLDKYSDTKVWYTHAKERAIDTIAYFKGVNTETASVVFDTHTDSLEEYYKKARKGGIK